MPLSGHRLPRLDSGSLRLKRQEFPRPHDPLRLPGRLLPHLASRPQHAPPSGRLSARPADLQVPGSARISLRPGEHGGTAGQADSPVSGQQGYRQGP